MTNICRPLLAPQINHPCQDTVFVRSPICMLILFFTIKDGKKKRQLIGYLRNGTISISFMVLIMHLAWRVKRQHKWVDGIWVFNVLLFLDGLFKPTLPIDCVLKIHKCDVSIVLSIKQVGLIKYLSFEKKNHDLHAIFTLINSRNIYCMYCIIYNVKNLMYTIKIVSTCMPRTYESVDFKWMQVNAVLSLSSVACLIN